MAFTVATTPTPAGSANANPAYSRTFIPAIWSTKFAERYYQNTFLARITTTNWDERAHHMGDVVKVRMPPPITVRTYQANLALVVERPGQGIIDVGLDEGWYFFCALDDVHRVQSDVLLLDVWADAASNQVKVEQENFYVPAMAGAVDPLNAGATAGRFSASVNLGTSGAPLQVDSFPGATETSAVVVLARLAQVLDEAGVPSNDRWALVPPAMAAALEVTPQIIGSMGGSGYEAGCIGTVCRFRVYVNNSLLPVAGTSMVLAGQIGATAFVSQLAELESKRRLDTFATSERGLVVSGLDVVQPKGLALAYVSSSIGSGDASAGFVGRDLVPITPSNTTILPPNKGFIVRTPGVIAVQFVGAPGTTRTLPTMAAGAMLNIELYRVMTATTAALDLIAA